jgi:hypothetical protein
MISIHPQWNQQFPILSTYLACIMNKLLHQGGVCSETNVVSNIILAILFHDA